MKLHRHLFVDEVNLSPGTEWTDRLTGWRFLRITRGVAYWLGRSANRELSEGDVVVLSPSGEGTVRASQLGEAQLHWFDLCPELLSGFFTLAERHYLDALVARSQARVQFLPQTHAVAEHFAAMLAPTMRGNALLQRCEALRLAVLFFGGDISRHRPPATNSTYALHRFRQLIQQMPDQEILKHSPEQLAEMCGCSLRHFARLFRKHFGVPLRKKQTELQLIIARQLLMDTDAKVIQVAMESGYRSLGWFNAMFKRAFGMTPTEWRKKFAHATAPRKGRHTAIVLLLGWAAANQASAADTGTSAPTAANGSSVAAVTNAAPATTKAPTFEVRGYEVRGNTLLPYSALEQALTNYVGSAVTFETIRKALADLQLAYRDRGFVTASVTLPQQQLTNGLVKVQVREGRLTEVNITGNRYFTSNNVMRALPDLRTNEVLNGLVFQQELDRANSSRDRQIYPVIGPGPDPGTTALNLKVKDRLPLHGRVELNNYSTPDTPELRMNAALQYNNLWQLEHQLGVQYSFTPADFKEGSFPFYDQPLVASYSAFYRMPLSAINGPPRSASYDLNQFGYDEVTHRFRPPPASERSELLLYASRSSSDTGSQLQAQTLTPPVIPPAGALQVSDRLFNHTLTVNEDLGARFLNPLPEFKHIHSTVSFGPDYKTYHSSSVQSRVFQATIFVPETGSVGPPFTTFTSPPTRTQRSIANSVEYLPLSLNWDGSVADKSGTTYFNINNTFNWSGFFDNADDFRAVSGSRKADGTYYVGNFGLTRDHKLPKEWILHLHADGQWTSQPLINIEQIGFGGNAGVRGYRDGQVYTDTGWRIQIEPRTPQWNLGLVNSNAPFYLRAFAFVDYGEGYLLDPGSRRDSASFLGTGFGLIGNIGQHLDFRLTVGIPLLDTPGERLGGTTQVLPAVKAGTPRVTFAIGGQF